MIHIIMIKKYYQLIMINLNLKNVMKNVLIFVVDIMKINVPAQLMVFLIIV